MFYAPGLIFGGTEGIESRFLILRSRINFRRYRERLVPFSCFALPDSFLAVPRASGPVYMFCAPRLVFDVTEGVRSRFHILRSRPRFRRYRGSRVLISYFALPDSFWAEPRVPSPVFIFCAPELVFDGSEVVGFLFHYFRSTRFGRYRGRRVSFSCYALLDKLVAVPRASGLFFMFCARLLVFDGIYGVGSRLHVLRGRTHFLR
jgi:hypothetical protein